MHSSTQLDALGQAPTASTVLGRPAQDVNAGGGEEWRLNLPYTHLLTQPETKALDTTPTPRWALFVQYSALLINGWHFDFGRLHIRTQFPSFPGIAEDLVAMGLLSFVGLIRKVEWWWSLWMELRLSCLPHSPPCPDAYLHSWAVVSLESKDERKDKCFLHSCLFQKWKNKDQQGHTFEEK